MAVTRSEKGLTAARVLVLSFLTVGVVLPLGRLGLFFLRPGSFDVLVSAAFGPALAGTAVCAFVGAASSTLLAFAVALSMARSHVRHEGLWVGALTLPMLIPSIAHGLGIVYLLGSNGVLTSLLGGSWDVYGAPGIVLGSILYTFPPSFLLIRDALRYQGASALEASLVMGMPRAARFRAATLPVLAKPLLSAFFSSFALIATDYGVPLAVGGRTTTVALLMYRSVAGSLDLASGVGLGAVLLAPALVSFLVDLLVPDCARTDARLLPAPAPHALRDGAAFILRLLVSFALFAPIACFVVVAFVSKWPVDLAFTLDNLRVAALFGIVPSLVSSLVIAVLCAVAGAIVAWLAGYLAARSSGLVASLVHAFCLVTMAVPGLVFGLAYMVMFQGTPLYRTIAILLLVNCVHFFASPYLMARNAFAVLPSGLEGAAAALGIPRGRLLLDVFLPQTWGTLCEMALYIFSNCMVTISAVSFLSSTALSPLSLLISDFESQALIECSSVVALVILCANLCARAFFTVLSKFTIPRGVREKRR